jgi:tetratricopeptide (TPR) repeat protein
MFTPKLHGCLISIILMILLPPQAVSAEGQPNAQDLPLSVCMVLAKITPMLRNNEYSRAIETLLTFQAQGVSAAEPGRSDSKGHHHPEIYFALGNCHLLQGHYEPAAAAYRQALTRDASHSSAWLNLAKACYEMKQYTEAGHSFARGYKTAKEKIPEHLYYSAAAYMMADKPVCAIECFEQLLASHPTYFKPEWKEHLVHALLAVDQPRRALPYIRELADTYSGDKQIQWQEILLYQYLQLAMAREALNLALTLTRQAPTVAKWWKALTHIQLNAGQYEEALTSLIVHSYLAPLSLEEKKLLADLNLQLGIPINAAPVYETCLKEKPDEQLLQRLVLAYRQLGRPETALECIDAFGVNPNDTDLMLLKGELLYSLKEFEKAAAAYRRAAQNGGRQIGRAWLMAGYAAWQMNDISASRDAFAKAVDCKEEKKAATEALRQLKLLFNQ